MIELNELIGRKVVEYHSRGILVFDGGYSLNFHPYETYLETYNQNSWEVRECVELIGKKVEKYCPIRANLFFEGSYCLDLNPYETYLENDSQ